jgi:iron complex outermembrane receptor protein
VRSGGSVVPFAHVRVKGTTVGTNAEANGTFIIKNVAEGKRTFVVTSVGYAEAESELVVKPGEVNMIDFELAESATELQTVEVLGRKESSYKSDYSFAATKIESRTIDVPQSISAVTKEIIKDQNVYRLNEAVKNVAGINQFSHYDDITMRGFRNSDYRLINGMRAVSNFWSSPLLVNIERIEFIKGPSSALFSNSNPGGTINMVTKKPLAENRYALDFSVGSFNTLRTTGDFTGPLHEDKTLLYRLNIGYENAGSFRDQIKSNTLVVAPSITFLPNDKTTVNFDLNFTDYSTLLDRGRPTFRNDENLLSTPINFNLNQPGDLLHDKIFSGTLSINHKLTERISLNASYMKFTDIQHLKEHGFNSYITDDSIGLYYDERLRDHYADNLTAYATAKIATGNINHTLLGGFDYIHYFDRNSEWWADETSVGGFSLVRPFYVNRNTAAYQPIIDEWSSYETQYNTSGVYFQDLMKWNKLQLLVGFRWDRYQTPNNSWEFKGSGLAGNDVQEAILPRIGFVHPLMPGTNVYATFNKGYQPVDPFSNSNPRFGGPFRPMYSELLEAGVKREDFGNRLLTTLSIYQITMNNVLVSANDPGNPDRLEQRGQERARGVELEASGKITDNLSVQASYAYNRAEITRSDDESLVGLVKENAPTHVSGSWIKYTFSSRMLNGLGVALGHSHVAERRTFDQYSSGAYLMLPSYVVFNAGVYFTADRFSLSANINNLTDKKYWVGGYNFQRNFPGAPRNFLVKVSYNF